MPPSGDFGATPEAMATGCEEMFTGDGRKACGQRVKDGKFSIPQSIRGGSHGKCHDDFLFGDRLLCSGPIDSRGAHCAGRKPFSGNRKRSQGQMEAPICQMFDVSAEVAQFPDGKEAVLLKIASPQIEINVWLRPDEAEKLNTLAGRDMESKSLRLGLSAGQGVRWSRDAEACFYLLVGDDDETWDIGLTFDSGTFTEIANAVAHPVG